MVGPPSETDARASRVWCALAASLEVPMSHHPKQQVTTRAESKRPSRAVTSAVASCLGALIVLEPLVIDTKPSLQIFQAVFVIWFWALFMFGSESDRRSSRK